MVLKTEEERLYLYKRALRFYKELGLFNRYKGLFTKDKFLKRNLEKGTDINNKIIGVFWSPYHAYLKDTYGDSKIILHIVKSSLALIKVIDSLDTNKFSNFKKLSDEIIVSEINYLASYIENDDIEDIRDAFYDDIKMIFEKHKKKLKYYAALDKFNRILKE